MEKSMFEKMGGTYTRNGDYLLPDLKLPSEDTSPSPIGMFALRRKRYLKEHSPVEYRYLVLSGQLDEYLSGVEQEAEGLFSRLCQEMAAAEGITEELKARDQMEWVRRMNGVRARAREIVITDFKG